MKLLGIVNAERVADLIAIPFFLIAFLYFLRLPHKTLLEYWIMLFLGAGFVLDLLFTLDFLQILS